MKYIKNNIISATRLAERSIYRNQSVTIVEDFQFPQLFEKALCFRHPHQKVNTL